MAGDAEIRKELLARANKLQNILREKGFTPVEAKAIFDAAGCLGAAGYLLANNKVKNGGELLLTAATMSSVDMELAKIGG